jgi:hypothetical protein
VAASELPEAIVTPAARSVFSVTGPVVRADVTMTAGVLEILGWFLLCGAVLFWLLGKLQASQPVQSFRSATSVLFTEGGGYAFPFPALSMTGTRPLTPQC